MIRFSVLVKVNGIRHYFFIDLILPSAILATTNVAEIAE
jgi:hypothetical protein